MAVKEKDVSVYGFQLSLVSLLMAVAGINVMAIPVVAIAAVFARGYVRGLTAAMLEGA